MQLLSGCCECSLFAHLCSRRVIYGRAMTDVAGGITVAATVRTMHAMRGRANGRTRAQGNALSVVRAADAVPCSTAWNSSERVCGQPVW